MRWFWNMWETLASPKKREFKCEFELRSTHSQPCCGSPWTKRLASTWCWPEERDGPKNLGLVHPSPWERKVEGSNCKKPFILPFGDGNEMFLSVNWFATVTLRWFWFEPGTWRFRNWKLKHRRTAQGFETSGCLTGRTYWNYQLWKMDALTGNVFPSLRRHSVNLLFIKVWCK